MSDSEATVRIVGDAKAQVESLGFPTADEIEDMFRRRTAPAEVIERLADRLGIASGVSGRLAVHLQRAAPADQPATTNSATATTPEQKIAGA